MEENTFDMMQFDLPRDHSSIIKVIGVGGGGSNAVNYMYEQGIKGVDFMVCNTDAQALDKSPVPLKIQLGATLTEGRGAGSIPEVGRNAAVENLDDVKAILANNTTMVFVTAGMGGGTGTGAAPIIARAAKEMGILTVGIVTIPFNFEGKKRTTQADEGLREMRDAVDTLLIIRNDKLRELYGNLALNKAFSHADEVLCTAAKGIAEVITLTGEINVDMNDVKTVMKDSGVAIMGSGQASGEGRAMTAVSKALESPLLNDNDITGAKFILLNITYGQNEVLMDEIMEITDYIQEKASNSAEVIWGYGADENLTEDLCVTVIATGFNPTQVDSGLPMEKPQVTRVTLDAEPKEVVSKLDKPTWVNPVAAAKPESIDVSPEKPEEPFIKTREERQASIFDQAETPAEKTHEEELPVNEAKEDEAVTDTFSLKEQKEEQEPIKHNLYDSSFDESDKPVANLVFTGSKPEIHEERMDRESIQRRNQERELRLRELTSKLKTPSGIAEVENEPAYVRRNVQLDNIPHSSESNVSRFTLSEETSDNGEKRVEIKSNNPFLDETLD